MQFHNGRTGAKGTATRRERKNERNKEGRRAREGGIQQANTRSELEPGKEEFDQRGQLLGDKTVLSNPKLLLSNISPRGSSTQPCLAGAACPGEIFLADAGFGVDGQRDALTEIDFTQESRGRSGALRIIKEIDSKLQSPLQTAAG